MSASRSGGSAKSYRAPRPRMTQATQAWWSRLGRSRLLLLLPVIVLHVALLFVPLIMIARQSFAGGLGNYRHVLDSPLLTTVARTTIVISATTTVVAVFLAYLLAALLWRSGPGLRIVLVALVLLPFWTGILVKNFAWVSLLQDNGPINDALRALGITDGPITLLHNRFAVIVGMVHYVLPYAVFPIYVTMTAIDERLERAARSLGARTPTVLFRVILPLTLPGVYAAALLVFIISAGFFVTPVVLGGDRDVMMANLVDFYANRIVDFGAAAAVAMLIAAAASILIVIYQRLPKESQYGLN